MELTRDFKKLSKDNAPIAGGKGASLGEMTQAGIPVPPGFVVLSSTFDQFIKDADLVQEIDAILGKVDHKEIHTVESASDQIQGLIKSATMPESIADEIKKQFKNLNTEYVAVRSSATAEDGQEHAWAGQLDSFLNTTEKDLIGKVQHCWASLFTPRAIFYRFEKGLHTTQISVAVVVQKMVNSEISGIAFSVHPVTEDRNQLIIEAGLGLGEAIVSGQITPDSYVVEKEPRRIIDVNINTQARALYRVKGGGNEWQTIPEPKASSQVLSEVQILELSNIILGIEKHYGFPCDIEWAFEASKFYVVQSRPITTLSPRTEQKDIIPDLKKFTLTFSRPQSVLRDEIAYTLFEKYMDIPHLRVMTVPLEGTNRAIYVDSVFTKQLFDFLISIISTTEGFDIHLKNYKKLTEDFESAGKEILKASSDKQELLALYKKALKVMAGLGDYTWMPIPIEKILVPKFIELLKKKLPDQWEEINHIVSSPVKLYGYQNMRLDICEAVISGQTSSEKLINKLVNRHKWQGEYAYAEPLCEEEYFKTEFAKLTAETAQQERGKILDEIKHNKKNLEKTMALIKDETLLLQARVINEYTYLRTDRVDLLKKLQVPVRGILDKVAEHLAEETGKSWTRIKVTNLLNSEIIDFLSGKFMPEMDSVVGRGSGVYYRTRDEVKVITDVATVQKIRDEMNASTSGIIKGTIAFKGKAKGLVKMVFSKADISNVLLGDILVARTTMPDYTPAMEIASAFVTEEGGVTSHAAIIARELKKPCIVGTGNCTKILKDGDLVEVDANNGVVKIIEKAK